MVSFLSRYQSEEHQAVWNDLRSLREAVRERRFLEDAWAVAVETMTRVRQNVETVIQRLSEAKYEFGIDDVGYFTAPLSPPNEQTPEFAKWLEDLGGTLGLCARAWIEVVGDVNLTGNHPLWPEREMYTDALVVEFEYRSWRFSNGEPFDPREHYLEERAEWVEAVAEDGYETVGPFGFDVAPDMYHKANVSGGGPYRILVPDKTADATIDLDGRRTFFTDYLRHCFDWGGFPGFADRERGRDCGTIASLKRDLLPF